MLQTLASDEFLVLADAVLRRGQRFRFRAAGTSMEPFIRSGDILIVDPVDDQTIRPGDVVLYRCAEGPRVHRVTGRTGAAFRVQGDAPGCLAEEVARGDVLGRVGIVDRGGKRVRLDRGVQRAMRWPMARVPVGRRLARTLGGWELSIGERMDRDGADLRQLLRLCGPSAGSDALLPDSDAGWERLTSIAEARDLAPLLYFQTRRCRWDLPSVVVRALAHAYYAAAARHAVLTHAVGQVLTAIRDAGLSTVVLKGVALAETAYPSPASRPMSDVDLLVRPDRLRATDRVLADLGYRAVDGRVEDIDTTRSTSLSTLDYRTPDPLAPPIHLHWHLVNTSIPTEAYRDCIRMDEVWDEALPLSVAGADALRMAPHHLLVYLCEHALRPAHAMWKPLQVADLAWAIACPPGGPDWGRVVDVAQRFRLDRMTYLGLWIVREQMEAPVPDEVLTALRPAHLTAGERLFLRQALKGRARPGMSYFVHLALRRTILQKARFIARTLFPPRTVVSHHTSGGPWGWYLRRCGRVLKHALWPV